MSRQNRGTQAPQGAQRAPEAPAQQAAPSPPQQPAPAPEGATVLKAINTLHGVKGPRDTVTAADLVGGAARLEELRKAGYVA